MDSFVVLLGIYGAVYTACGWVLHRFIKNIWLTWAIVWLIVSTLDFLSSYERDDYPDSSLTPFEINMTLPGDFACLIIYPVIILRFWLLQSFVSFLGHSHFEPDLGLSEAWYSGERGGWDVFAVDFSMDFILCGLFFLAIQVVGFVWKSVRYAKPQAFPS